MTQLQPWLKPTCTRCLIKDCRLTAVRSGIYICVGKTRLCGHLQGDRHLIRGFGAKPAPDPVTWPQPKRHALNIMDNQRPPYANGDETDIDDCFIWDENLLLGFMYCVEWNLNFNPINFLGLELRTFSIIRRGDCTSSSSPIVDVIEYYWKGHKPWA